MTKHCFVINHETHCWSFRARLSRPVVGAIHWIAILSSSAHEDLELWAHPPFGPSAESLNYIHINELWCFAPGLIRELVVNTLSLCVSTRTSDSRFFRESLGCHSRSPPCVVTNCRTTLDRKKRLSLSTKAVPFQIRLFSRALKRLYLERHANARPLALRRMLPRS